MIKPTIFLFMSLLLIGCDQSSWQTPTENTAPDSTVQGNTAQPFTLLASVPAVLAKADYEGKIVTQRQWRDANGENLVLFTQQHVNYQQDKQPESAIFAYHYVLQHGQVTLLRRVYDFVPTCSSDLTIEFIEPIISVTDLDNNQLGEITFAYQKACISDLSPLELKLLILENGHKHIIRGTTTITTKSGRIKGKKQIDEGSFATAPAAFLSHANALWDTLTN
ncbi:hypothetical protein CBF23_009040 [Marinomonas agarivorans]|nr:hypothetical protein CBF23_009040 [Marinomonas agarivorans]